MIPKIESKKVSASVRDALLEPVNLAVIFALSIIVVGLAFNLNPSNIVSIILFIVALGFLMYFLWAVTQRSLEVTTTGVAYNEALLRRYFSWREIEGFFIERQKKQITFHRRGKNTRIHYIGINPERYINFDKVFLTLANQHQISYADHWNMGAGNLVLTSQGITYKLPGKKDLPIAWDLIERIVVERNSRTIVVITSESEGRLSYENVSQKDSAIFENSLHVLALRQQIEFHEI